MEDYLAVTEALTQPSVRNLTLSNCGNMLVKLAEVQDSIWLTKLLREVQTNQTLANAACGFLEKLDGYHDATNGMPVDAIGIDNIVFNTAGRCHMGDALETRALPTLAIGQRVFRGIAERSMPSQDEASILINVLNYVRGVNGIAIASGSPVRVVMEVPQDSAVLAIERALTLVEQQYGMPKVPHRVPHRAQPEHSWLSSGSAFKR